MINIKKGDSVYYARVNVYGNYDCCILQVHAVNEELKYFTAIEKIGKGYGFTFLFDFKNLGEFVFTDRAECVEYAEKMENELKKLKRRNVNEDN